VGQIGSGIRVSVSFLQKYQLGSVLRMATMSYGSRKQGLGLTVLCPGGLTSSPAYNVEPVTNTSSSSCANNGRQTPRCTRRRLSRLCFSQFATRTVDNTVDLYAAKPDIRPESHFLPTPPAFDVPVMGVPVGISPPPFGMEKLEWRGYPMVKNC